MPISAYMEITAAKQGALHTGGLSKDSVGRYSPNGIDHNKILVQGFRQEVMLPTDPHNGQPVGRRRHLGFTVTKIFDRSTPLLHQAVASGEQLTSVKLEWFRTPVLGRSPESGEEEHYMTHLYEDATIVRIVQWMPDVSDADQAHVGHMESVTMTYKRVTWTHEISGTEGYDEW